MCQICTLALRHQKLSKSEPPLFNTKNLSVLVTLNQQTIKLDKLSTSNNQPLDSSD